MNLDVLPPTDLGALRTLFAGVTAVLTLGNLPWFARTIDIKRSGLDAVSTPLDDDMENIDLDELPREKSLLIRWLPILSIPTTMVVGVMFATVLLIATFDILPRTMLLAAIPLYLLFYSQAIDSSKVVRKTSLLPWTCLLLAIAPEDPGGQALSIVAIKILLVNMWFTAGLRKAWNGGWAWWNGSTLRHHLAIEALENRTRPESSGSLRLAMMPHVCTVLAIFTMVAELGSPLVILPGVAWACLLAYLVFLGLHLGIFLLWRLDYLTFCFLPIGFVLLVPSDFTAIETHLTTELDWRTVATIAVSLFFITNCFLGFENWPIHDWPMFSYHVPWGHVRVRRLFARHAGRRMPVVLNDRYINRGIARHGRYLLWYGEQWTREKDIDPTTIEELELIETTIDEHGHLEDETLMKFERLTQLRRWLWRPPWEESTRRDSS
ncbi:MAG: hypothetical protein CMJ67_03365 [Planctomycetaceae bacterium]|nr:hypothetical protein [Planctomycetaceae bacterium]